MESTAQNVARAEAARQTVELGWVITGGDYDSNIAAQFCCEHRRSGRRIRQKDLGAGVSSCRQWQENRTAENLASFQQRSWIAGFLSGYNAASFGRDFLASQPDAKAIHTWIDNYCSNNPLDDLSRAVTALKDELLARAR